MPKSLLLFLRYPIYAGDANLGRSMESRTPLEEFFNHLKVLLFNRNGPNPEAKDSNPNPNHFILLESESESESTQVSNRFES